MSAIDLTTRLDEMHNMVLSMLPTDLMDLSDIDAARARIAGLFDAMPAPELPDDVSIEDVHVPSIIDGDPDVRVKVYRPANLAADAPAVYWIHGGGMVLLSADGDDARCVDLAATLGALVVSVDYRLAPEAPFPGPMNDCYSGLKWLGDSAAELGVDPSRIAVGGASAGGGLAAGLALMARDKGGPALCFQLLIYPMIDHRNTTPSSQAIVDERVWNRGANIAAWEAYLGDASGTDDISIYASPSMAEDLSGLPPAYINVGDLDMFLDEDIDYAQRLLQAGVPCDLRVYTGAFHGSNGFVTDSPISVAWRADEMAALNKALNGS